MTAAALGDVVEGVVADVVEENVGGVVVILVDVGERGVWAAAVVDVTSEHSSQALLKMASEVRT